METELRKRLAVRIKKLRKKYKYTQWELSDLSGVDDKHIQLLEGKKHCDVKLGTLAKLAKAFHLSVSEFLNFK